jgi:hypothetical protein
VRGKRRKGEERIRRKRMKKQLRRKRGKGREKRGRKMKWERRESYSWLQGNVRDDESKQTEEEVEIER